MSEDSETANSHKMQWYFIGLVDALGQSRELVEWSTAMWATRSARVDCDREFSAFAQVRLLRDVLWQMRKRFMEEIEKSPGCSLSDERFEIQQFSDTVLFYSPVVNDKDELLLTHAYGILGALAKTMLIALSRSIPLRGSIELGYARELFHPAHPGETYLADIYGPGVARAYRLETEVAQLMRIVVGERLVEILRDAATDAKGLQVFQFEQANAEDCLSLLARDKKGVTYVDFAGKKVREILASAPLYDGMNGRDLIVRGLRFAASGKAKWYAEGDAKLGSRYAALVDYYRERVEYWGIDPEDLDLPGVGEST